ncbi:MAG: hypothetical protein MUE31_12765 [Candidatus Nanopelagicales bacterium]|nr:hypothetical protein [Candidatus Nanopelagicales bacterium]
MSTTPMATAVSPTEASTGHDLKMAWLWCGIAALLVFAGMVIPVEEGGTVILFLAALAVAALGVAAAVWSFYLAGRVLRRRTIALIPLLLVGTLLFWGPMVMLSAFARQFGWGG